MDTLPHGDLTSPRRTEKSGLCLLRPQKANRASEGEPPGPTVPRDPASAAPGGLQGPQCPERPRQPELLQDARRHPRQPSRDSVQGLKGPLSLRKGAGSETAKGKSLCCRKRAPSQGLRSHRPARGLYLGSSIAPLLRSVIWGILLSSGPAHSEPKGGVSAILPAWAWTHDSHNRGRLGSPRSTPSASAAC